VQRTPPRLFPRFRRFQNGSAPVLPFQRSDTCIPAILPPSGAPRRKSEYTSLV